MIPDHMETKSILCGGRWPLKLLPGVGGHYGYLNTVSSRNELCFMELLEGIPQGISVVEHFGGVGIFSTIIQNHLKPSSHVAFDLDRDCAAQLQSIQGLVASQGDAKLTMGTVPAQLVVLDFAFATIKHFSEWPWERIFALQPDYIIWSDVALRRLGLHREIYSKIFGRPIDTHEDYVWAFSDWMQERFGYRITRESHHVYSYFRVEKTRKEDFIFCSHVNGSGNRRYAAFPSGMLAEVG